MKYTQRKPAVIVLEDGSSFKGYAIGKVGVTTGEICFNTGMTGYQEIYTDPSYTGQILLATASHIGNYGVTEDENESDDIMIEGLVCKKFSDLYFSRPRAYATVQQWFEEKGLVGISDVDTRALVRHVRDKGAMNAIISSENLDVNELLSELKKVPSMQGLELSSRVSTKEPYFFGNESADHKVAVIDLGVKRNILRCLAERGCYLKVFPMNSSFGDIMNWEPDGIMLSNGPGDPAAMPEVIATVKHFLETPLPKFGICLGHQVLALAAGLSTYKMHNGHRGVNHPVKNLETGTCEVTSQNHGFVVDRKNAESNAAVEITHLHLNDDTLAGMRLPNFNTFSVQYHPESSAGPNDSRYLFDTFIDQISAHKKEHVEA